MPFTIILIEPRCWIWSSPRVKVVSLDRKLLHHPTFHNTESPESNLFHYLTHKRVQRGAITEITLNTSIQINTLYSCRSKLKTKSIKRKEIFFGGRDRSNQFSHYALTDKQKTFHRVQNQN
jgi:hypothetical protein